MPRSSATSWLLGGLLCAVLGSCSTAPAGRPCTDKAQCAAGGICREGLCVMGGTRPEVTALEPPNGTTTFDVRNPIRITFTAPVQGPTPIGLSSVSGAVSITTSFADAEHKTVVITPSTKLQPGSYTVTIPADLEDASGNVLVPPGDWTFVAPSWLPVVDVAPVAVDQNKNAILFYTFSRDELGGVPHVAPDGRRRGGIAYGSGDELWVAAVETASGDGSLANGQVGPLVVRHTHGSGWTALPSVPTAVAQEAVLAVSGSAPGTPVVAYTEDGAGRAALFVKRWTGSAWATFESVATSLNQSTTSSALGIALAVDGAGVPTVAWWEGGNTQVARWGGASWVVDLITTFGADPTTGDTGYRFGPVSLALDGTTPYLAFPELKATTPKVSVYAGTPTFTLGAWALVGGIQLDDSSAAPGTQPSLALDQGKPAVAYLQNKGCATCLDVAVANAFGGSAWSSDVLLNRDGAQYAAVPQVASIGSGRFLSSWQEGPSSGGYRLFASTWIPSPPAGTTNPVKLGAGDPAGLLRGAASALGALMTLDSHGVPAILDAELKTSAATATMQLFVWRYNAVSLP